MSRTFLLVRRRLLGVIPVLAIVAAGTFLLLEAAPGDAVDAYLVTTGGGDPELIAALRMQWGLDQSVAARLWFYLWALVRGDLGWSVTFSRPVLEIIRERLPTTLMLMTAATALSFMSGSLLGVVAGARPGSWRDRLLSTASLALYAVPSFWLGLVLAIIFSVQLRWLPLAGIETIASGKTGLARAVDIGAHLVLPVASLGLIYLALYLRVMRAGMAEVWRLDCSRLAGEGPAPPHDRASRRPQRSAAVSDDAWPSIRGHARRFGGNRKRLFGPGFWTPGARGGRLTRYAAAPGRYSDWRRIRNPGQFDGRYCLWVA
jgi:peptide/nickel transport system permease protein